MDTIAGCSLSGRQLGFSKMAWISLCSTIQYVQVVCFLCAIVAVRIVTHVLFLQEVTKMSMLRAEYLRIIRSYDTQRLSIVDLTVDSEGTRPNIRFIHIIEVIGSYFSLRCSLRVLL